MAGAAAGDPDLRRHLEITDGERLVGAQGWAGQLATLGALRPGLTPERARDIIWAINSVQTWDLLVSRRGWSKGEYAAWLGETLAEVLFEAAVTVTGVCDGCGGSDRRLTDMGTAAVSAIFDPTRWREVEGFDFTDITYHRHVGPRPGAPTATETGLPTVRIAFDRPEVRNAFRPHTVDELYRALDHARMTSDVGCVLLTGNGPSARDGGWAFCSGGDQRIRGRSGYQYALEGTAETSATPDPARAGRLHILEVQRLIRFMPKIVIAVVPGWAAGGGHSLHVVCDLTLASAEHARFKQTDADVGSFDAGYGSAYLSRLIGQKFAREIFFLGREYTAEQMHAMGAVNQVVPHDQLETVALQWASEINGKSPTAQRMLKYAFNLADDGMVGQQLFAGEATRLAYGTDEAAEGRDSFLQKRPADFSPFPWAY